jgi:hypothetical protein
LLTRAAAFAVAALIGLLSLAALHAPTARADGDPASDVLLGSDVFYPFEPVSHSLTVTLSKEAAAARKLRAPIKVALIPTAVDLGTIGALFGRPQNYADFLAQEIAFVGKAPLLIVMADGYGTNDLPPAAKAAVKGLPKPAGTSADDLASAAIQAVPKILAAEGDPLPSADVPAAGANAGSPSANGSRSSTGLIIGLIAAAVVATGAVIVARMRKRSA